MSLPTLVEEPDAVIVEEDLLEAKCFQVVFAELLVRDAPVTWRQTEPGDAHSAIILWKHLAVPG